MGKNKGSKRREIIDKHPEATDSDMPVDEEGDSGVLPNEQDAGIDAVVKDDTVDDNAVEPLEEDTTQLHDGEGEEKEETADVHHNLQSDGRYRNKQRCLVLCSRGVTARYRHLLEDLRTLIPHHRRESKLDPGDTGMGRAVNDIAEMKSCNTVLFLECRKRQDAYMWISRIGGGSAAGPSIKFHVSNIHTMDELRLTGNCMKGSRPVLSFDESFGRLGHLKLMKELFIDVFGTPRGHPKSKPFVDRVMAFYYADKRVRSVFLYRLCMYPCPVCDSSNDERMSDRLG